MKLAVKLVTHSFGSYLPVLYGDQTPRVIVSNIFICGFCGILSYSYGCCGYLCLDLTNYFFPHLQGLTQTAMMFQETSPIVQLSYSWEALLISSRKRTVLWNFGNEQVTQIGQKERKR